MKVNISSHKFIKTNHITIVRGKKVYDKVKCSNCGLEGIRYGLSNEIHVKYDKHCSTPRIEQIIVISDYVCASFGFEKGKVYNRVECPAEYMDRYSKSMWIYSNERKEPVRILPDEYLVAIK